ncbi:hypothetical protein [Curtobacterium sp. MCBD17_019]|uniref:hypothetical protein n=2 Tax=unclassified Curtobacterium TaxID=257496 RepID=UPI0011B54142|nr:hypothetical protein [Curtobacterium sp. MCBD17_019]
MSGSSTSRLRSMTAIAIAASVALLGTGCSYIHQQIGDAWAVTYEIHVDRPTGAELTEVEVEGARERGDAPEIQRLGSATTDRTDGDGSRWTHDAVVLAEQRASVTATPGEGATATCRILLDGKRVIATATSTTPGARVQCSATTPEFNESARH